MGICRQCHVRIKDDTSVCPLCQCVLEREEKGQNVYPNVAEKRRRLVLAGRIYLFVMLLVGALLFVVNYQWYHGVWWSVVATAALAYLYLVLRFAVLEDAGYRVKTIVLSFFGVMFVLLTDYVTGYRGWSLNYVLPGVILLIDCGIALLMLVNHRNWQSYLLFQIFMILCSIVPLVLWRVDIITNPVMGLVAFGVSLFLFLGSFIIGDRRARVELKRRFHVR